MNSNQIVEVLDQVVAQVVYQEKEKEKDQINSEKQTSEGLTDGQLLERVVNGLSDGTSFVAGVNIVPGEFREEAEAAFSELLTCPSYGNDESIQLANPNEVNTDAKWVNGAHPALNYRGNAIKRSKIWLQKKPDAFFRYGYTGWQWKILFATTCLSKGGSNLPRTRALIASMSVDCEANHWIVTKYRNGYDSIGHHSDKMVDWVKDSKVRVVKFGCPRIFEICAKDGTLLFRKLLPSGTSVTMTMDANELTTHAVPVMDYWTVGLSGSIVSRMIEKEVSLSFANKMVDKRQHKHVGKRKVSEDEPGGSKIGGKPKMELVSEEFMTAYTILGNSEGCGGECADRNLGECSEHWQDAFCDACKKEIKDWMTESEPISQGVTKRHKTEGDSDSSFV